MKKLLLLGFTALLSTQSFADDIKVYAAASLTNALTDIAKVYQATHPEVQIVNVFGASSTLSKQIFLGAESDLYFSADLDWMNYLIEKEKVNKEHAQILLTNQLVFISPISQNGNFVASKHFKFSQSFKGQLCTGQLESTPVGKYAKQSLVYFNWLNDLKGRIVTTEDVRSALAFVERGECNRGIVYKTDALMSKKVKILGAFPSYSHHSIEYPLALTLQGENNKAAMNFKQFIQQNPQAKAIFQKYGFGLKNK